MLRNVVLGFALIVAGIGYLLCFFGGQKQAWPMALWGSILFVLILLERWRYERSDHAGESGWVATDEQFIDPETGKLTRVFYHSATGDRRYVVEE